MVKPIVRDVFFLGQKSEPATKQDLNIGQDLQDTLAANQDRCVGMAANMREAMRKTRRHACMSDRLTNAVTPSTQYEGIGIKKRIIIVNVRMRFFTKNEGH